MKTKKVVFLLIFAPILFLGGLGIDVYNVQFNGVLVGFLLISLIWIQKRIILLPRFIIPYSLFLILFLVHSLKVSVDAKKSLEVYGLFLGGGLFWIASYNLKKELAPYFDKIIILLGLVFAGLYFYNNIYGDPSTVRPWSLYLNYSAYRNHNSIGDLWAVVLVIIIFYLLKNTRNVSVWLLAVLGSYLLYVSQSRAAFVALAVGVIYLVKMKGWVEKYKKIFTLFLMLAIALFLIIGAQKTTLFTRQYYIQGLLGFIHNPEGVGVGNFGVISRNPDNHLWGLSHFASVAHNLPLEIVSGMGILGFVFVYWLFKVFQGVLEENAERNLVYRVVFITLFVNFFFHSSYLIPTMFWLWFGSLGLAQSFGPIDFKKLN